MELVVYYILPIAGSLFLIGYMFYAMYQMRGHPADKKSNGGLLFYILYWLLFAP